MPLLFCATTGSLLYSSLAYTGMGALVGVGVLAAGALPLLCLKPEPATAPAAAPVAETAPATASREPDVIFVPTPQPVVDRMLELAEIKPGQVLYDLGSGDGRIPVTAAKKYGIKAIGIDINPERIAEANENAKKEGVTDKVEFREADLFTSDISQADVVTLYLLQSLNVKLRPKLLAELKLGTKVISHSFDMADEWAPEKTETVGSNTIYMWTVPERK